MSHSTCSCISVAANVSGAISPRTFCTWPRCAASISAVSSVIDLALIGRAAQPLLHDAREHPPHHRLEALDRQMVVFGVEAVLVVVLAEIERLLEAGMAAILLAGVEVELRIDAETELEDLVVLDHPMIDLADEGLEDLRRDLVVAEGVELLADIVEEGADYELLVLALTQRARRALQRVLVVVDLPAMLGIVLLALQEIEHRLAGDRAIVAGAPGGPPPPPPPPRPPEGRWPRPPPSSA